MRFVAADIWEDSVVVVVVAADDDIAVVGRFVAVALVVVAAIETFAASAASQSLNFGPKPGAVSTFPHRLVLP